MEIFKCQPISGVALAFGFLVIVIGFLIGIILMFKKDNCNHLIKSLLISAGLSICVAYIVNTNGPKEYIIRIKEEAFAREALSNYKILEKDNEFYKIRER